ncbi:MAG: putative TetR-family transcriptional regulator [Acidimicrobiales bacterium]|nr:putative TetR-family transcriptional regulator [Acidimicrobiales bacterium]
MTALDVPAHDGAKRAAGRPRSVEVDHAILDAARHLLVEEGYGGMSIEAIAGRAGVGKAAIYRRWATKAEVLVESLREHACADVPLPDTGDLRADLLTMLTGMQCAMAGQDGPIMAAFVAEKVRHPELREEFDRVFVSARRAHLQRIIGAAVARGDLAPSTDVELLAETGPAILAHRLLVHSKPADPDLPARIVAQLVP